MCCGAGVGGGGGKESLEDMCFVRENEVGENILCGFFFLSLRKEIFFFFSLRKEIFFYILLLFIFSLRKENIFYSLFYGKSSFFIFFFFFS